MTLTDNTLNLLGTSKPLLLHLNIPNPHSNLCSFTFRHVSHNPTDVKIGLDYWIIKDALIQILCEQCVRWLHVMWKVIFDTLREKNHQTLLFPSALRNVLASFSPLFWFMTHCCFDSVSPLSSELFPAVCSCGKKVMLNTAYTIYPETVDRIKLVTSWWWQWNI